MKTYRYFIKVSHPDHKEQPIFQLVASDYRDAFHSLIDEFEREGQDPKKIQPVMITTDNELDILVLRSLYPHIQVELPGMYSI